MATRRSVLGRGLDALIPDRPTAPEPGATSGAEVAATDSPLVELPVDDIRPNPDQPRRRFDEAELRRLTDSIREHGLLQPVVVRRGAAGYELIVGERRWRAARAANLPTIRAVVADVAAPDRLELALVENVQRHDLNPIELALAFRALADNDWTQEEIGRRVGFDRSSVANHLRLLDLSPELQQDLEANRFQMGHAKALLAVSDPTRRRALRGRIVRDQLTVRQAEAAARALEGRSAPSKTRDGADDADHRALVDRLRGALQTQVRVRSKGSGGRIEIDFASAAELDRLVASILAEA